jgi:hypothetical protein
LMMMMMMNYQTDRTKDGIKLVYWIILIMKFRFVFWDVLPCKIIVDRRFRDTCCLHNQRPDDGGITYLWNGGRQLFYKAVHPRRQIWTSYSPLWELKISHFLLYLTYFLNSVRHDAV